MAGGPLLWIDPSAGIAGDMLLAALVDAGARPQAVRRAVDAALPGTVRLAFEPVDRAGLRATAVRAELLRPDQPHRPWEQVRSVLRSAALPDAVRSPALAVFAALARAEAAVHGVAPDDVEFHEVGSWDSIADVVGVCAALADLDVAEVVVGRLALGSGTVRTAHGLLPVPVPAVLELARGWPVQGGGDGELATPTGVALATTLATGRGGLPPMTLERAGTGAGARDTADRPNVVRVVLGRAGDATSALEPMVLLETTVDDLDPRVWPAVLDDLLGLGAADAWLTPALMKKGRPGHVLTALARPGDAATLRRAILDRTTSLGVRHLAVEREVLGRAWLTVGTPQGPVDVKVAHRGGRAVHVMPEFEDAARVARASGTPVREVLEAAAAAARRAGIVPGAALPADARDLR